MIKFSYGFARSQNGILLFNPTEFGKVFVLVDFGNVAQWAKDLWPEENKFKISIEVDIEKLVEVCNWVSQ